ncbi:MAG: hypothetical protein WA047_07655 [Phenylobacterium sp.]|uniref:hypothetical protein n=1 Tax=Phenylobacterium sp. TaxID=1871053 RepID=UPI003BB61C5B
MSDELHMKRFTKAQLAELNGRMRAWTTLEDFAQMIEEVHAVAGFYAVSQGGLKIWREAWVAISCGQLSHALRVKLGDDPPDFELDYCDHRRQFEIVDVMPAGRKLGQTYDNYAERWNNNASITLERVGGEAEHNALPSDLESQLQAKASKAYNPRPILVADIHHELFPWTDFPVEQRLAGIAAQYLGHFPEVWLRKGAHLLRITPHGATRLASIKPQED